MSELRIGIIGARRRRSGLGEYLARFFKQEGVRIAGIVGRSLESARDTSVYLEKTYGIHTPGFADLPEMLDQARLDGLAICSPTKEHRAHLQLAAGRGVHIFCEKPLLWNEGTETAWATTELLERLEGCEQRLLMNTQWPYTLAGFRELYPQVNLEKSQNFSMTLAPSRPGKEMILESISHPISLLMAVHGPGEVQNLEATYSEQGPEWSLRFDYSAGGKSIGCRVALTFCEESPRPANYAFEGMQVERRIQLPDYSISLEGNGRLLPIPDPQQEMVKRFLMVLKGRDKGHSREEILCHARTLDVFMQGS